MREPWTALPMPYEKRPAPQPSRTGNAYRLARRVRRTLTADGPAERAGILGRMKLPSPPPLAEVAPPAVPAANTEESAISVVIPVHDEEDNVEPLHDALTRSLEKLGRRYEIIFVDDGSRDET